TVKSFCEPAGTALGLEGAIETANDLAAGTTTKDVLKVVMLPNKSATRLRSWCGPASKNGGGTNVAEVELTDVGAIGFPSRARYGEPVSTPSPLPSENMSTKVGESE